VGLLAEVSSGWDEQPRTKEVVLSELHVGPSAAVSRGGMRSNPDLKMRPWSVQVGFRAAGSVLDASRPKAKVCMWGTHWASQLPGQRGCELRKSACLHVDPYGCWAGLHVSCARDQVLKNVWEGTEA